MAIIFSLIIICTLRYVNTEFSSAEGSRAGTALKRSNITVLLFIFTPTWIKANNFYSNYLISLKHSKSKPMSFLNSIIFPHDSSSFLLIWSSKKSFYVFNICSYVTIVNSSLSQVNAASSSCKIFQLLLNIKSILLATQNSQLNRLKSKKLKEWCNSKG